MPGLLRMSLCNGLETDTSASLKHSYPRPRPIVGFFRALKAGIALFLPGSRASISKPSAADERLIGILIPIPTASTDHTADPANRRKEAWTCSDRMRLLVSMPPNCKVCCFTFGCCLGSERVEQPLPRYHRLLDGHCGVRSW